MINQKYCQKCRTPLRTDSSLDDLNPAAFDLLVGSTTKNEHRSSLNQSPRVIYPQERKERYEKATSQPQSPLLRRVIPPPKDINPGMSFVEITESQIVTPDALQKSANREGLPQTVKADGQPLSWQIQRQERLYSLLSAHSDIDHPICVECTSLLLTSLNGKLTSAARERDAYSSFLKQLQHAGTKHKDDGHSIERELTQLQAEEDLAFKELLSLEEQKKQLEHELADLEDENEQLDEDEKQFWLARNAFNEQQHELETELASLQQKYAHDQKQFERLQRTNVYNDTFYISHDGHFGTINGLRLGRLPDKDVGWPEINAAWGQTLLLLQTLAERLSFSFQGYKLRPLGSTSRIEKLEYTQQTSDPARTAGSRPTTAPSKTTMLELYSSGAALERVFQSRKFDQGMVAFLDCLNQLGRHVEQSSSAARDIQKATLTRTPSSTPATSNVQPLRLPYAIDGDKIWPRDGSPEQAVSIKLGVGFAPDENFTKACKYVLTCCKYLLAHVSNLDSFRSSQP